MSFEPRTSPTLVISAAEQKRIDRLAFAGGVDERLLMESAGNSVVRQVLRHFSGSLPSGSFAVIAGKGGNGGDAVVAALGLGEAGCDVQTYLAFPPDRMTPAAAFHAHTLIERFASNVYVLPENLSDLQSALAPPLRSADCVIDGLLGSGTTRPAVGRVAAIIEAINRASGTVVAIDLPSGILADGAEPAGPTVDADITVAMHFLKPSHVLYPARQACGRIRIADVAYPEHVLAAVHATAVVPGLEALRSSLPERPATAHKGSFGRVLVVAGSRGLTGAAILCCRAALRTGAGMVTLACPASLEPIFETTLPEVITVALPDRDGIVASVETTRFRDLVATADALAVGPGLSRHPALAPIIERLVAEVPVPLVLDADGLWPFGGHPERIAHAQGERVLTPHTGELSRLVDLSAVEIEDARLEIVREVAGIAAATVVLKGAPTVVSSPVPDPDGTTLVALTGNHGLATGGSGDVLTGLIAGLLAQKVAPCDAAYLGAYVHGSCADRYAKTRSARSLLPSDLILLLPHVLYELEHGRTDGIDPQETRG